MGLEPEDLMRLQPADVHRGQRSFTPREQAGHMTASTPSISVNFLLARRGPSTQLFSSTDSTTAWAGGST